MITVRHPNLHSTFFYFDVPEQSIGMLVSCLVNLDLSESVFTMSVRFDFPLVGESDLLKTVADTENRYSACEDGGVDVWGVGVVNRVRRAGKDDTWMKLAERKSKGVYVRVVEGQSGVFFLR